ncbi:hypothetical protein [Levilactobacillus brevis]|uniref:hypothetical protein n=1 Tax=Levilactobacillus brevis TaxID=1580 RepID=UPI003F4AE9E3
MATPNVGILTTTGKALIDKVNSGQAKISFSKVVFSSMDNSQLSDTQIKALTAIAPQEVVVSSPETTLDTNSGETRIRATGTNETLADGVYVKTYGVFAKDDTGNEILYGVTVSPNPNYFPAYDGVTPQAVTYSYKTVIQETSNITMTNSNDVYVSQEDLTEAIAKIPQPDLSSYDKTDDVDKKLQNKQDKLGYTAADDSKVVHDNGNGTIQVNGAQVNPYNKLTDTIGGRNFAAGTGSDVIVTPSSGSTWSLTLIGTLTPEFFKIINQGTVQPIILSFKVSTPEDPTVTHLFDRIQLDGCAWGSDAVIGNNYFSILGFKWSKVGNNVWEGTYSLQYDQGSNQVDNTKPNINLLQSGKNVTPSNFTVLENSLCLYWGTQSIDWTPAPEDKVNVADMRKPASDVAGIEEVNAKQDKIGYTPADDSKVAHLSGANNFDTVPTVNNNPLLLASSLPSDLARTSQQTNFTAGLQSGGVNVATAADLKSVEASAWRQLDNKYITPASGYTLLPCTTILYKIDDSNHKLYLSGSIALTNDHAANVSVTVQLGSIVKSILTSSVLYVGYLSSAYNSIGYVFPGKSSTNLTFSVIDGCASIMASTFYKEGNFVTYDKLV